MSARCYRILVIFLLLALVGCSGLPIGLGKGLKPGVSTDTAATLPPLNPTATSLVTQNTPAAQPAGEQTPAAGAQFVRLWLPPEFDPERSGSANALLKDRLGGFEAANPGVQVEVRVKALDGPGGMLDALVATSAAAPEALPDLALLPRPVLESAALKGLLYPYDGLTDILDNSAWFEYALQMAHVKTNTYGIPFSGDLLVLAHTASVETPPLTLGALLTQRDVLLFPAADPQALFTLSLYLSQGGKVQDAQGRPMLEAAPLDALLDYYQQANLAEVMPYTLTEITDDDQVWQAMVAGESSMAITWASTFLHDAANENQPLVLSPIPTPDGAPFTLASGWSWALAGQHPTRRALAVRLAEFLVDKDFLAKWTLAAGYLPPRVDALQSWPTVDNLQVIEQASYSAWLEPPADLIATIGPALQTAVAKVLSGQSDAKSAAQSALEEINQP